MSISKSPLRLGYSHATLMRLKRLAVTEPFSGTNMPNSVTTVETVGSAKTAKVHAASKDRPLAERDDVTVDELERLPLPFPAELYDGKVVFKMPNLAHGIIQNNIGSEIKNYLKIHPIGVVSGDTNFRLWPERATASRAPDVSFILKDRLPDNLYSYPAMAPDLAVEILSPDDSFEDMMEKGDEYLSRGSKLVWIVITRTREVMVCSKQGKHSVKDTLVAPELLPGFELPVEDIFVGLEKSGQ